MKPAGSQPGILQDVSRAVTAIIAAVVGLTFLFGFGNVLSLALRLGVPVWVAPLIAPAVDLSILGLLLATWHLALHGASMEDLRPLRRFALLVSATSLALNVSGPASGCIHSPGVRYPTVARLLGDLRLCAARCLEHTQITCCSKGVWRMQREAATRR